MIINKSFAQIGGLSIYQILEISPNPSVNALGGKVYTSLNSPAAVYFNPAALDSVHYQNLELSYRRYLAQTNLSNFIYAFRVKGLGCFAVGANYLNYGKIPKTDEFGYELGYFSASDLVTFLGYSFYIDSQIRLGINLKWIYSQLEQYISYGYAIDLGICIKPTDYLDVTFVLRNKGKQIKPYFYSYEPLPYNLVFGTALDLAGSPFKFHINMDYLNYWKLRYQSPLEAIYIPRYVDTVSIVAKFMAIADEFFRHLHFGSEVKFSPNFKMLIGYNYRQAVELSLPTRRSLNGLSMGLFIDGSKLAIQYSFNKIHLFTTHNLAIILKINNLHLKVRNTR